MNASVSHVEVAVQLRRVFGDFSCFGRLSCLIRINFKKASKSHFFHLWRRDPVLFGAGFGQEKKLLSCERHFIGCCNLLLANCMGVAASQLLCVAVAQVLGCERSIALVAVSSFATRLLANSIGVAAPPLLYVSFANRMGMVAPKLRRFVFDEMFLAFGAFHFPSKLTRNPQILLFVWLWRRDIVLEQVLAQRRAEMI